VLLDTWRRWIAEQGDDDVRAAFTRPLGCKRNQNLAFIDRRWCDVQIREVLTDPVSGESDSFRAARGGVTRGDAQAPAQPWAVADPRESRRPLSWAIA
jgi:hypothetical protein